MTERETLTDAQKKLLFYMDTMLDTMFNALVRSLKANGVPSAIIQKSFITANAAVQMIAQSPDNPYAENKIAEGSE